MLFVTVDMESKRVWEGLFTLWSHDTIWHRLHKWCHSVYAETPLTRGFPCDEDWKIKNVVFPYMRKESNKTFYLENLQWG